MEVHIFMSKRKNKVYSVEFKVSVIMGMREHHLGYRETVRRYFNITNKQEESKYKNTVKRWERIYLEEGVAGLSVERRGRATKADNPNMGRPRKKPLDKPIEDDLIAENQRLKERLEYLEMENEYLKKLDALVLADEQKNNKKR